MTTTDYTRDDVRASAAGRAPRAQDQAPVDAARGRRKRVEQLADERWHGRFALPLLRLLVEATGGAP